MAAVAPYVPNARVVDLAGPDQRSAPMWAVVCTDDAAAQELSTRLAGWPEGLVGIGRVRNPGDDASIRHLIRRGHVVLRRRSSPDGIDFEVGPRAVDDLPWIRMVRTPLGAHTRGSVNAFLINTEAGLVVVDTSLSSEAGRLLRALRIAGHVLGDVVLATATHCHADHVGGLAALQREGWLAADGRVALFHDTDELGKEMFVRGTSAFRSQLAVNGIEGQDLDRFEADLALMSELADWPVDADRIVADERLYFGDVSLEVIPTPGHSPDHVAFLARRNDGSEAVLLGDMTLGQRMPRCGVRDWLRPDPLADLLASWDAIVRRVQGVGLPAHGAPIHDLAALHGAIRAVYARDVATVEAKLSGRRVSAADLMREQTKPDDAFGPRQFAFYGSLAMLKHLTLAGRVELVEQNPDRYSLKETAP